MLSLPDWCRQYDERQNNLRYKSLACIEGHATTLDEMDRLGTDGFCPKCGKPITDQADEAYTRILETYAENSILARDHFIRTGELPQTVDIPIGTRKLDIVTILGDSYVSSISRDE